jgi:hypothetical protein
MTWTRHRSLRNGHDATERFSTRCPRGVFHQDIGNASLKTWETTLGLRGSRVSKVRLVMTAVIVEGRSQVELREKLGASALDGTAELMKHRR